MIELTEEQLKAVDAEAEPHLVDPRTKRTFVLVGVERYELLRTLAETDSGLTMTQVATLVERAMRDDDADDPTLGYYQEKYGRKP